jgi:hypothetical protein
VSVARVLLSSAKSDTSKLKAAADGRFAGDFEAGIVRSHALHWGIGNARGRRGAHLGVAESPRA